MEIVFLGTSSGVPTKTRNVSATVVKRQDKKAWFLVDCGEGTQHQILHTKLALNHLSAIFITHVHGDHCFGLPGLLASASMSGRTEPITVIAPTEIKSFILSSQKVSDTFLTFELTKFQKSHCHTECLRMPINSLSNSLKVLWILINWFNRTFQQVQSGV